MPTISMFYGILIRLYFYDDKRHSEPHIHAEYGEYEAVFSIKDGEMINGKLPNTARKLVKKWYGLQKENILKAWEQIQNDEVFDKVPPLD